MNALNDFGESPIFCISNPTLVPILVSAGADLTIVSDDGETAMQVFEADENAEMVAAIKAAAAAPAPIPAAPAADFLTSVEENDVAGVRAAIASNSAVANTPSKDGDLPLSLVVSIEVAQLLLDFTLGWRHSNFLLTAVRGGMLRWTGF